MRRLPRSPVKLLAWLLAVAWLLACGQSGASAAGGERAASASLGEGFGQRGSSPLTQVSQASRAPGAQPGGVRSRVALQGRANAPTAILEVTRVPEEVRAEVVAEGLEVPWEVAFTPDGRILVTERSGRIRVVRDGALQRAPFATLPVTSISESGLMGLALHPDFAANSHLFVCYTYRGEGGRLFNRVARLTDVGGVGVDHRVVVDRIPGAPNHNGCRLRFGPDGKLYVTMGDAQEARQAQDLGSLSGKVLRLEPDGAVPADNPFPGSYVYTYGHRNPQGLDWHPRTGDLFISEHGPDTDDEVNILRPGGNYGWPGVMGLARDRRYVDPILTFTPTVAPAGAAFYSGQRLAASWDGNFLFATLAASHLHRVVLNPSDSRTVLFHQGLFQDTFGRLRAVALAPDGHLYFTTSNRDGRGYPRPGDDKLLRLAPAPPPPGTVLHPQADGEVSAPLAPGTYWLRWAAPGYLTVQRRLVVSGGEGIDLGEVMLRAGDLNGDGTVGGADVAALRPLFGRSVPRGERGDYVDDGVIDILDLTLLASNWGRRE